MMGTAVGICQGDVDVFAQEVNAAQQRLLYAKEATGDGWWGGFAEMAFNVTRDNPYITAPRDVARLININVCDAPIALHNQYYEYLQFGNGRLPKSCSDCRGNFNIKAFSRNNVVTMVDMTEPPNLLRVYMTDNTDATKRVLFSGKDANGNIITSQDVENRVSGEFVTLAAPFATTENQFSEITGIQKGVTNGQIRIMQVNPATGEETLLLTMEPGEKTAWYRRYYLDSLPSGCCGTDGTVQVRAIAKLDLVPAVTDTDYLLIQNVEALIQEVQSIRYTRMDSPSAKQMAQEAHAQAIRLMIGELTHYLGKNEMAISFHPFGASRLEKQRIGNML